MRRYRNPPRSYFGTNLQFLRWKKGLTQEELAEELKVTRSRLSAYEENRNEPGHLMSFKIAKFFKIGLEKMIAKKLR